MFAIFFYFLLCFIGTGTGTVLALIASDSTYSVSGVLTVHLSLNLLGLNLCSTFLAVALEKGRTL